MHVLLLLDVWIFTQVAEKRCQVKNLLIYLNILLAERDQTFLSSIFSVNSLCVCIVVILNDNVFEHRFKELSDETWLFVIFIELIECFFAFGLKLISYLTMDLS